MIIRGRKQGFYGISAEPILIVYWAAENAPFDFFNMCNNEKRNTTWDYQHDFSAPLVLKPWAWIRWKKTVLLIIKRKFKGLTLVWKHYGKDKSVVACASQYRGGLNEGAYNQALHRLDQQLLPVLAQLENSDAVVILTAEHGYHFAFRGKKGNQLFCTREQIKYRSLLSIGINYLWAKWNIISHTDILLTLDEASFRLQNTIADYAQSVDLLCQYPIIIQVCAGSIISLEYDHCAGREQYHIDDRETIKS